MALHVCHVLDSLSQGGLEHQVLRLIEATDDDVSYTVVYFGGDERLGPAFARAGAGVVNLDDGSSTDSSPFDPRLLRRLVGTVRSEGVDVVHCHTSPIGHATTRLCARVADTPVIGTFHNRADAFHPAARVAERLTRPLSACDVAVSMGVERSFVGSAAEYVPGQSTLGRGTYTIYNGIDVHAFEERVDAARSWYDDGTTVFLNVGRYTEAKGQETLIRAMAEVVDELPEARLLLVGWGNLETRLDRLARDLGLEREVSVTGRVESVDEYYANADVFVLPSTTEGLSVVLLEAMAARLPIIATDIPGTREAVVDGDTGVLVPVGAVPPLADAMCRVADPERRERMGESGYARVTEKFPIEGTARSYLALYRQIVDAGDEPA